MPNLPNLPDLLHPAGTAAATATATASLGLTSGDAVGEAVGEAVRALNLTHAAATTARTCQRTTFAAFCAPRMGPSAPVTAALASARLGQAWAQAVLMHWCRLQRQGGIDVSQPLWVLDLAPGDGSLAACFLPPLWALLQGHGLQDWPVHYLACAPSVDAQQGLRRDCSQHPRLDEHLHAGRLQTANWPARTGAPLLLGDGREPRFGVRNPLVALALGGWSSQPAPWHGVHEGQCFSAAVQASGDDALALSYDWLPAAAPHRLLLHYAATVPEAPLLLSEQALGQIDALADFSAGRYLLLAADAGVSTERQIREQAFTPPTHWQPGQQWLPVNFHALARHEREAGAEVVQQQCRDDGWVLHLSCRDDALGLDAAAWQALTQCVLQAQPEDEAPDDDAEPVDAAILAQQLRNEGDAAASLARLLRGFGQRALAHDPLSAATLRTDLMRAWAHTPRPQRCAALGLDLGQALIRLGAWGDARQVLAQCRDDGPLAQASLVLWQVHVERCTGQLGSALRVNQQALRRLQGCTTEALRAGTTEALQAGTTEASKLSPYPSDLMAQADELRGRLNAWLGSAWYFHEHMHAGELCLELMGPEHADGLRQQLRDPQIAAMAQLPAWGEVLAADDGAVEYALLHRELGLVGGIGFRPHADMAFFHFWMGTDFQGQGLALPALRLLMRVLPLAGVGQLFSAVYADNWRCRQVLARAGFGNVAAPPGQSCTRSVFVHRSLDERALCLPRAEIEQRCQALCAHLHTEPDQSPHFENPTPLNPTGDPT